MNSLIIDNELAGKFEQAEKKALDSYLKAADSGGDMDDTEKAAIKILAVVAKNRQTMTNRASLGFKMATVIANPTELRRYVESTNPVMKKQLKK